MSFLDGYKTYISGGLMILIGILQLFGVAPAELSFGDLEGMGLIVAGLGLVGVGGKLDKLKATKKK